MKCLFLGAAALCCLAPLSARAQVWSQTFGGINADIPDGSLSGLVNSQNISGTIGVITDVDVTLTLDGTGFGAVNGDFYVYLQHDGQVSVLMNRPGSQIGSSIGYDDNGLNNITFHNGSADIHNYRLTLSGDNTIALSGPLTGTWGPDGRNVSPLSSLDITPRTAGLDVFKGGSANGNWTLFVADVQSGGAGRLDSWGITVTTTPVPEPRDAALVAGLALGGFATWRRWKSPAKGV